MTDKAKYLEVIGRLSPEALKLLAELAQRPGVEQKLLSKAALIKMYL